MSLISISWRRSTALYWVKNFVETIVDEGDQWFLIAVLGIVLFVAGFCVLLVMYDPVALKISEWLVP